MTRKAINREKSRVRLLGMDGLTVHAEGEMLTDVVENTNGLIRQGKHYRYIGFRDGGIITFMETSAPYVLTEF